MNNFIDDNSSSQSSIMRVLQALQIFDTPKEPEYDSLVELAASMCNAPMAVFTFVDEHRQWFKARVGIDIEGSKRCDAFCSHVVDRDEPLIVENASNSPEFVNNPFVTGSTSIRFYMGIPIHAPGGIPVGSLAIMDTQPRQRDQAGLDLLKKLTLQAESLLALRLERNRHQQTAKRLALAQSVGGMGSWELDIKSQELSWSDETCRIFGIPEGSFAGTFDAFAAFVHPDDLEELSRKQILALTGMKPLNILHRIIRKDGEIRTLREMAELVLDSHGEASFLLGTVRDVTEELEHLRTVREADEILNFHIHNSPLAVVEWDRDFRILRWSAMASEIFGWTQTEVIGKSPRDWKFVHEEDEVITSGVMAELVSSDVPRNFAQNRNYTRDGRVLTCEWYNSVLRDPDGNLISIFSLVHDITSRVEAEKKVERALQRESEARAQAEAEKAYFRSLFEYAPGLYVVLEPQDDFPITAVSDAYLKATRIKREQVIGRGLFEVFPEAPDRPLEEREASVNRLEESLQRVLSQSITDIMAVQRYPIRRPESEGGGFEERYWSTVNSPVLGPDRKIAFIIHRVEDVTEYIQRKEAKQEGGEAWDELSSRMEMMEADIVLRSHELQQLNDQLRTSEAGIREMFEGAATGIISTDREYIIREVNPAFAKMLGYTKNQLLGASLLDITLEEDAARCLVIANAIFGGEYNSTVVKKRFLHKNGETVWTTSSISAQHDGKMEVIGLVSVVEDITEQVVMEEQLRRSQRLEALGQLTGGIAHDFNNLLTVVLGNSEVLAEILKPNKELLPFIEMITTAAERGADLTHRLLAFARRQPLEPRTVDINELIKNTRNLLGRTLGEQVELKLVLDKSCGKPFIDAPQLESALLNLCINARDAMPSGGKLTLETSDAVLASDYTHNTEEIAPGEYVMLAISDTGEGIPTENLKKIFDPFFTTKEVGKGSGLGLSMVYGFVRQSFGHIRVYSEINEGTTFKLYLPKTGRGKIESDTVPVDSVLLPRGDELILLVEDDELVRTYAEAQLIALGYRVRTAADGHDALENLRNEGPVDLLFTDVVMPGGLNGRQLTEQAKLIQPNLKVLFTSGYTENVIVHHGRLDPGARLLSKPYSRADLARRVRGALEAEN